MNTGLPLFLVTELRVTFRQCALQRKCNKPRQFHSLHSTLLQRFKFKNIPQASKTAPSNSETSEPQDAGNKTQVQGVTPITERNNSVSNRSVQQSRELIPQDRVGRAVGSRRTVDAPIKVIPKADITPNLRLTPKERLHIEILTRRAPPVVKQIKPYKERLLIYHHGNLRENATIFLKIFGLVCAGVVSTIIVPAHYMAGSSLWLCGSLLLCGWFPSLFFHYLLKPNITRIHLRLPPNARASPESAMRYAKNLPSSAQLDLSFTRLTALPGTVTATLADLQPIPAVSQSSWRHANIRWVGHHVDKGGWLRSNPTEFLIRPEVGPGKAKRDVIPGIWSVVYSRLTESVREQMSRWKRT